MPDKKKQPSCEERIEAELASRIEDLRILLDAGEEGTEDLGNIYEYGLCVDYVDPDTFNDQPLGYLRYQLSYGGPSDEFRYYVDVDRQPYKIEYVFLDWFDGATRNLTGDDLVTMTIIWEHLSFESVLDKRDKS